MDTNRRLLAMACVTIAWMSLGAMASAGRLSVRSLRFKETWRSLEYTSSAGVVRCPVTLEGSFHSATFRKIVGLLFSMTTRGSIVSAACTGGRESIDQETLPWHRIYDTFEGALPRFVDIGYWEMFAGYRTEIGGITCSMRTTMANPAVFHYTVAEEAVTGVRADESASIPLTGGFLCSFAGSATLVGTGSVVDPVSSERLRLRLI
jgi:hypothetical protein